MGAYSNSIPEQNFEEFDNFAISLDDKSDVFNCISTPLEGSDFTQFSGVNGSQALEPGFTQLNGFGGSQHMEPAGLRPLNEFAASQQQVSMIPTRVPLQAINTSCYNTPPFIPPVTEQPWALGFPPPPPLYQQGPFYKAAGLQNIDRHQSMQQQGWCSGEGVNGMCGPDPEVGRMSVMEETSNGGGGGEGVEKKKKAIRWSKEEHRLFLIGIKKHKRGDWKTISRHLVSTRSATQVASHAQKYFSKLKNSQPVTGGSIKKKRTSIHDVRHDGDDIVDDPVEIEKLQKIIEQQHQQRRRALVSQEATPINWCKAI